MRNFPLSIYIYIGIDRYGKPDLFPGRLLIFICKVSIIRAFAKQTGIFDFQLITLGIGLLVLIEKGPRLIIESQNDQRHLCVSRQ